MVTMPGWTVSRVVWISLLLLSVWAVVQAQDPSTDIGNYSTDFQCGFLAKAFEMDAFVLLPRGFQMAGRAPQDYQRYLVELGGNEEDFRKGEVKYSMLQYNERMRHLELIAAKWRW
jgi:hypothetical protein